MTPLFSLIAIASATGTDPFPDPSLDKYEIAVQNLADSTGVNVTPISQAPSVTGILRQVYALMNLEKSELSKIDKTNRPKVVETLQKYQPVMDYLGALIPFLDDDPTTKAKLEKAVDNYKNQTATLLPSQDGKDQGKGVKAAVAQDGKDQISDLLA
eukprot:NODE_631_length_5203_cov_0.313480.p4 type:complete len:156 gc:universal NODE_631_length_5203_cov_0.313480:4523-4990(+)